MNHKYYHYNHHNSKDSNNDTSELRLTNIILVDVLVSTVTIDAISHRVTVMAAYHHK